LPSRQTKKIRNQHVHAEESTDAVGEKFAQEESQGHSMLRHDPRHELRIRQQNPESAKDEVNGFARHGQYSSRQRTLTIFDAIGFG
jgi:hypothetical protein